MGRPRADQYSDGIEPSEAESREYPTNGQEYEVARDPDAPVSVCREPTASERRYIKEQEDRRWISE
jgi:hypothetical protein